MSDTPAEKNPMQRPPRPTPSQHLAAEAIARQPFLFAVNLALVAFVAAVLDMIGGAAEGRLDVWLSAAIAAQATRLGVWAAMRRTPPAAHGRRARAALVALGLVLGTSWGLFGVLFFEAGPVPYRLFVPFVLAGVSAAAVASFAGCLPATLAFLVTSLAPYAVLLGLQDEPVYRAMALIGLLYGAGLSLIGRYMEAVMLRVVRLSARNADLVDNLEGARRELEARVEARTGELRRANRALTAEIDERRRSEARVRHLLMHDALTDLPNRLLVFDRLAQALKSAGRSGGRVAVMMLDLDDFKRVNDTLGHPAGDALLRALSERLRGALRSGDTVGRLGGDEFVVVLPDVEGTAAAEKVAAKLLAAASRPLVLGGGRGGGEDAAGEVAPRLSLGLALYPAHGATPDELLSAADLALYAAKNAGKGGHATFVPALRTTASARDAMAGDIRRALDEGALRLLYQPRVALRDGRPGRVAAAEALLRWQHPERGLLPAAAFLPAASGATLRDIGRWVLKRAAADAALWRASGLDVPVAVNLSPAELAQPGLPRLVERALDDAGLDSAMLELEVDGGTCRDGGADAALRRLAATGVALTLDDFGATPFSITHLRRLPLRRLKLDPALVRAADAADAALIAAIVGLGRALGLAVAAPGVERQDQLDALLRLGPDEVQGFYIARPGDVAALVHTSAHSLMHNSVDGRE